MELGPHCNPYFPEDTDYSFITSRRGKEKLVHQGFLYNHQRSRNNRHYFVCEHRGCHGTVILMNVALFNETGGKIKVGIEHNHPEITKRAEFLETLNYIKNRARYSDDKPKTIIEEAEKLLPKDVLPSRKILLKAIRSSRKGKKKQEKTEHTTNGHQTRSSATIEEKKSNPKIIATKTSIPENNGTVKLMSNSFREYLLEHNQSLKICEKNEKNAGNTKKNEKNIDESMISILQKENINQSTIDILIRQDIDSQVLFQMVGRDDLRKLDLTLGEELRLWNLINRYRISMSNNTTCIIQLEQT